ncbi:MAG: LapA family protein [Thermostichus sp. DG_1_6_bins_120]
MLKNIRSALLGLWTLILLILFIQNWGSRVTVVLAGQSGSPIPLSWVLLVSYGVGIGLGFLYVVSWRFHDWALQRQAIRKLNQLMDRVSFLESQTAPSGYYLPPDVPEPDYTPDPYAGRYSYTGRPPERIWPEQDETRYEEENGTAEPDWRLANQPYRNEEEEWDS